MSCPNTSKCQEMAWCWSRCIYHPVHHMFCVLEALCSGRDGQLCYSGLLHSKLPRETIWTEQGWTLGHINDCFTCLNHWITLLNVHVTQICKTCWAETQTLTRLQQWWKDFIMKDMHNGEMWYRSTIGTRCKVRNHGTICDISENGDAVPIPLYTCWFGLQLTLNTDWYSHFIPPSSIAKQWLTCFRFSILAGRPHSTGPVYWSVNNLPHDLCHLQVNVMCSTMMLGLSENNSITAWNQQLVK